MSLDQVVGQSHVTASLKQVVKDKRAKAFIFVGPSGTGKTTIARILANEFAGGHATAANITEIDAATNSGADDMRAIVARSMYRAVGSSPVRSILIDEAHRLSAAAWTILLKPIEEPPKHIFWMLCTTDAGKIPRTIETRCLKYTLKPVSEELIYDLLVEIVDAEKLTTPEEVLEAICEGASGSPRQALVLLESCASCESAAEAQVIMRSAAAAPEAVTLARFLLSGRGRTWLEAMRLVKGLEGVDAEGVRVVICAYLSAVLLNTKGDDKARQLLGLLEAFGTPYNASDKLAPLLHSLGLALGLDR